MGKIISKLTIALFFTLSLFLFNSCDDAVQELVSPEGNDSTFSVNGVYVVSCGGGLGYYRTLSYYDFDKNVYKENIYKNGSGYLPAFPTSIAYGNGYLFISTYQGTILKVGLLGDSVGMVYSGSQTSYLFGYDNRIFVAYMQPYNVSFDIRNQQNLSLISHSGTGSGYVSDVAYNGRFLYLTHSQCYVSNDSTLERIDTESGNSEVLPLNRWATGIAVSNTNRIIVGCKDPGNLLYTIDPITLQILDSVSVPEGFIGNICSDKLNPVVYFLSKSNKIISYNLSSKVFSTVILNPDPQLYYITAYLYDNVSKKHFVGYTSNISNVKGMLKIYNYSGIQERTYTTGVYPIDIVTAKYNYP